MNSLFPIQNGWAYDEIGKHMCTLDAESRIDLVSSFWLEGSWVFEIDVLTSPGGNSGVFYLQNQEFQVVSETHPNQMSGKQSFGGEYGDIAPVTYPTYPGKKDGEWNRIQIRKEGTKIFHYLNGQYLLSYFKQVPDSTYIRLQHHGEVGMCYRRPSFDKLDENLHSCLWDENTYASFNPGSAIQFKDVLNSFYYYLGYLNANEYTNRIEHCADYNHDEQLSYSDLLKVNYAYLGYIKPLTISNEYVPLPYCVLTHDNMLHQDNWSYDPNYFTIKDGVATGEGSPSSNTFLIYNRANISDFRLNIQVRVTGTSNSGIQYRSVVSDDYRTCGYQYEVQNGVEPGWGSGGMYDECGLLGSRGRMGMLGEQTSWSNTRQKEEKRLPFYNEHSPTSSWQHVTIKAFGNRHYHYLNGRLVSQVYDSHPLRRTSGQIALQLHSGTLQKVEFRGAQLFECN